MTIKVKALASGGAEIMIYDPIGADWFGEGFTAKRFVQDLDELGNVTDILVRINSPGGEVFDGLAIYNALLNHPAQVHVQIDGLAASIASLIAMAGDMITMGEGTMIMIHDPMTFAIGGAEDMRGAAEMLDTVKAGMLDAYVRRTGLARSTVSEMMDGETWLSASDAVEQGFADERVVVDAEAVTDLLAASAASLLSTAFAGRPALAWSVVMAEFKNAPEEFSKPPAIAAVNLSAPVGAKPQEISVMDPKEKVPASGISDESHATVVAETLALETARRSDIRLAFGTYADQHRELMDGCLEDVQCSVNSARKLLLEKVAADSSPLRDGSLAPLEDERDKFITGASVAVQVRLGLAEREVGNEFNGMSLSGLAAHAMNMKGISVRGLSNDQIARKVLASMTTSDFPLLMSNSAGKMLRAAYENFPNTWQLWCATGSVPDFKVNSRIQMGSFNSLEVIPEGGEYKYGDLAEEAENIVALTKGKAIRLSRQMIVNDDLNGFARRAQLMGRAAARTVNADAYALLTSGSGNDGPTMSDTGQLFNTTVQTTAGGHLNKAASGAAPALATIAAGRKAMRLQKDVSLRDTLNVVPATILAPVGLEDTIWALLNSTADPASSNSNKANWVRDVARLELVTDPFLDGISATAWWLIADPADVPVIEIAFLDGQQTPFVDDDIEWETDALRFKIRLDYGLSAIDWRGGYKDDGT